MIEKTLPLLVLLGFGCSSPDAAPPRPGTEQPAQTDPSQPSLAEAERLMRAGDVDGALLITDGLLKANPRNRAALVVSARGNIALFESGRQGAEWFLDDAIRNLETALAADANDPQALITLSWCKLRKSEFEDGRRLALEAADLLRAQNAPPARIADALLQAADNEMQLLVKARSAELAEGTERPGDETTDLAKRVLATLQAAEAAGGMARARVRSAQVFNWMNRGTDALHVLESGVRAQPDSAELNEALQDMYWRRGDRVECVALYKRMLKEATSTSATAWYLGRAQVALGDDMRTKTRWEDAEKAYADALATFRGYDAGNASNRQLTSQWIAICELSLGRAAYEQGRLDESKQHYFAAADACPLCAETGENGLPRIYDAHGGNYIGGLSLIGQAISEKNDPGALRQSLEFFEEIIRRHPGRFGAIYNNAALSARDLGVQVAGGEEGTEAERRARLSEAMALWEKSYGYYEKAVELEPQDARIVNDCGLMLVYHLGRDYDRARAMFDRAIELGEAQLAELPPDTPEKQRNDLEAAVGDAYENIGYLLQQRLGRPDGEWQPFYERAVTFYPYRQREAARALRGLDQKAADQDPRKAKFDRELERAKPSADAADWDSALLVMDGMAKEMNGYAPFHYHTGLWSLRYAEAKATAGGDPGLIDGLFSDAVRNLKRAVELDGDLLEPRLALGEALLQSGQAQEAADVADALLSHARSVGGAPPDLMTRAHALRARAAATAFVAKKRAGETDEDLLRAMRTSFREIETTDAFDEKTRNLWVATEQWAGAGEQAVQVQVRAWRRNPESIGELVQTGATAGASQSVVEALASETDATTLWWNGRAHFDLGVQLWSSGKPADALTAFDDGIARFEQSAAANEAFRVSCEQWTALCLGQKAFVQISQDDFAGAEESLLTATEKRPDVFTNDLGGGSSIKRGVLVVADRWFQRKDLGHVVAIYRRVGAAVPDDVDVANNEGLFCRDHADALSGRGGELTAETRDLYEASYAAYTRACRLDPTNVRLRNDRALILVYSLKRDLELAESILKSAVVDGERQLKDTPPSDAMELRNLEEAVGDAYGNLAVLYMERKDYGQAKQSAQRSLDYYPFQGRAGVGILRRIEAIERQADGAKKDGE